MLPQGRLPEQTIAIALLPPLRVPEKDKHGLASQVCHPWVYVVRTAESYSTSRREATGVVMNGASSLQFHASIRSGGPRSGRGPPLRIEAWNCKEDAPFITTPVASRRLVEYDSAVLTT